jgi:hypothetical protein
MRGQVAGKRPNRGRAAERCQPGSARVWRDEGGLGPER